MKIPFDVGLWEGVDGSSLLASINPGDYASELKGNLTLDPDVYATIDRQAALSGSAGRDEVLRDGRRRRAADRVLRRAGSRRAFAAPGPLKVRSVAPDQLAKDLAERLSPRPTGRASRATAASSSSRPTGPAATRRRRR